MVHQMRGPLACIDTPAPGTVGNGPNGCIGCQPERIFVVGIGRLLLAKGLRPHSHGSGCRLLPDPLVTVVGVPMFINFTNAATSALKLMPI